MKNKYCVRVVFPCDYENAQEVTWFEVEAISEKEAIKKARKLGSEWLRVEVTHTYEVK